MFVVKSIHIQINGYGSWIYQLPPPTEHQVTGCAPGRRENKLAIRELDLIGQSAISPMILVKLVKLPLDTA